MSILTIDDLRARPRCAGRHGHRTYSRILALSYRGAQSHIDIAPQVGIGTQPAREILWRLHRAGLVHIAAWLPQPKGSPLPAFKGGAGADAAYPGKRRENLGGSQRNRPELAAFVSAIHCLQVGATRQEMHEATGISHSWLRGLVAPLREAGLVRVASWERAGNVGKFAEVLMFGAGRDAPKPAPMTQAQKCAKYRAQARARRAQRRLTMATAGLGAVTARGVQDYRMGVVG